MPISEATIREVVQSVLSDLAGDSAAAAPVHRLPPAGETAAVNRAKRQQSRSTPHASKPKSSIPVISAGRVSLPSRGGSASHGVFASADDAVEAAHAAFLELSKRPLADREKVVQIIKRICREQAEELGRMEFEETKVGRLDAKIEKLGMIDGVLGTETLTTEARSGDRGICLIEHAPFGVICAITPVTHSLPTLACNAVNMIAAGNTVVCNPHPSGKRVACEGTRRFNRAIEAEVGLSNLITIVEEPTLETADAMFAHRSVRMLVVTGGPAVAKAALQAGKKAVVAGPGNPPVVVDETADLDVAASATIAGASYDNNLLCIGEKEVFVVADVFDAFLRTLSQHGAVRLSDAETTQLTDTAFGPPKTPGGHAVLNRDLIGQDAAVLAAAIGKTVPAETPLLFGVADASSPFVQEEQMMPFLPVVKCRDFDEALARALDAEHGYGHTAICHSQSVERMTRMGRAVNTTLYVQNGPSTAALGSGGEGYLSFSIATPTGEGVTTPLTFTRQRQNIISDALRIV